MSGPRDGLAGGGEYGAQLLTELRRQGRGVVDYAAGCGYNGWSPTLLSGGATERHLRGAHAAPPGSSSRTRPEIGNGRLICKSRSAAASWCRTFAANPISCGSTLA